MEMRLQDLFRKSFQVDTKSLSDFSDGRHSLDITASFPLRVGLSIGAYPMHQLCGFY